MNLKTPVKKYKIVLKKFLNQIFSLLIAMYPEFIAR